MSDHYEPELGQLCFGNPTGEYPVPQYAAALISGIAAAIEIAFWNREQREWDRCEDPRIKGLVFRPYYWGDDDEHAVLPNLEFEGIEIRWYKYIGRGMSVNKALSEKEWCDWYTNLYNLIQKQEGDDI